MSRQKQRKEQFLSEEPGGYTFLSYSLIRSALSMLRLSLEDRKEQVFRSKDNHYSYHSIGSIVLLITGLDSWLNELTTHLGRETKKYAEEPISKKYHSIVTLLNRSSTPQNEELRLAVDVRHEIVHYLPRTFADPDQVPSWFKPLVQRGLLISHPIEYGLDYKLGEKIGSYKLCYWVWQTISDASATLLNLLGTSRSMAEFTVKEMEKFRLVCPPEKLGDFDKQHGITLID